MPGPPYRPRRLDISTRAPNGPGLPEPDPGRSCATSGHHAALETRSGTAPTAVCFHCGAAFVTADAVFRQLTEGIPRLQLEEYARRIDRMREVAARTAEISPMGLTAVSQALDAATLADMLTILRRLAEIAGDPT